MTLKEYVLHQLREMKREMLESIDGMDAAALAFDDSASHSPAAWVVQHACANVDYFLHKGLTGRFAIDHEPRYLSRPLIGPEPGDEYPSPEELVDRWRSVCEAAIGALDNATEARLQEPTRVVQPEEALVESCLRVINHQNAHMRQIWCLRGLQGEKNKYPHQQTWLA